jgi:hypothetical protein
MAAVVNGDLSLPGKRKRELTPKTEELYATNEICQSDDDFGEILKDVLQILSKYVTSFRLVQHCSHFTHPQLQ